MHSTKFILSSGPGAKGATLARSWTWKGRVVLMMTKRFVSGHSSWSLSSTHSLPARRHHPFLLELQTSQSCTSLSIVRITGHNSFLHNSFSIPPSSFSRMGDGEEGKENSSVAQTHTHTHIWWGSKGKRTIKMCIYIQTLAHVPTPTPTVWPLRSVRIASDPQKTHHHWPFRDKWTCGEWGGRNCPVK